MRHHRFAALIGSSSLAIAGVAGPLAAAADETSKPPETILFDVARDLAKVRSLHIAGTNTDKDGTTHLSGDLLGSGGARLSLRDRSGAVRMILLPKAAYLSGSASYWKASGASSAASRKLAGHWVKVPDSAIGGLSALLSQLRPKEMASCVTKGLGTLAKGGTAKVGGRRAVIVVDRGDRPGTTPGRLYVAASGPALPLRLVQTGRRRPGGTVDARCDDPHDTSTRSDLRLSRFNAKITIAAPKHALTITDTGASSGSSGSSA